MADYSHLSPEEQQEKWLDEGTAVVKQQAFLMKRALDNNNTRDSLKYASNMLCELRTSLLSPKNYYELYMLIFDEMRHLEHHFYQEYKQRGRRMVELYELVQHAGNILPRLYLLICVGSVYIKSKETSAKGILKDLVEMCRGVQHPMRGLFLRNYLLQLTKDKLPDLGNEYGGAGGDVMDSLDFVLANFGEMNKLWVRMQHQGPQRDRDKREKERLELRILVGTNLVRMSQLDGMDCEMYKQSVLPRIIEQVLHCKDQIAQQYLMECIIQVFPDENHLQTLESLVVACTQLQSGVDIRGILVGLMDRLADFAKRSPDLIPEDINIFKLFVSYVAKVTKSQTTMDLAGILSLQVALLNFALNFAPTRLDYVDNVLGFCAEILQQNNVTKIEDAASAKQIVQLLTIPLESYDNVLTVLDLANFPELMGYLPYNSRKTVATATVKNIHRHQTKVTDVDKVEKLFAFIQPLVKDDEDQPSQEIDKEDFDEEQGMVASLVHMFASDDTDQLFKMYSLARRHFGQGGTDRIRHTLVPLVFRSLILARTIYKQEQSGEGERQVPSKKIFGFALETVTALGSNAPSVALRLFLQCAQEACNCQYEDIAYEFVTQSFILFEDEIADSKVQEGLIAVFVGTLGAMANFGQENYDTLITKTTQYSAKLLKKPDQCRAVMRCSHLFWNNSSEYRDGKRVLECLQRSLKIADVCMQSSNHVSLFVDILDHYLYYFENKNEAVAGKYLKGLVDLINENESMQSEDEEMAAVKTHYNNTLRHIKIKGQQEGEEGTRYREAFQ